MSASSVFPKGAGDVIYLQDYNVLQSLIYSVKTNFYRAACLSSALGAGSVVGAAEWNNLKADVDYCIAIQGIPLATSLTTKVRGAVIYKDDINLYSVAVNQANANKRPYYSVTSNVSSVDEGAAVTFYINTMYVPDGTVLYWVTSGTATASDFTDGVDRGSFTIISPSGMTGWSSVTRTALADSITEGTESFVFYVYTDAAYTNYIGDGTAVQVTVNDTSITPPATCSGTCGGADGGTGSGGGGTCSA